MAMTLAMTACHDDEIGEYNFNATMEQPTSTDSSKVYLQNERFVYWELNDRISIFGNNGENGGTKQYTARLVDGNGLGGETGEDFGFFNGVFITTMPWGSNYFLGLYPQNENNTVSSVSNSDFGTVTINMPAVQTLRTDGVIDGDITFNKNVFPMVAWYGGQWTDSTTAYNLDFHSVASIVRIQLFNSSDQDVTVDSIVFTSRSNATQLSGPFTINGYKTEDPHVTATGANPKTARVTLASIANGESASLGMSLGNEALRSFYLVLPAYQGRHASTTFQLEMTVHASKSGTPKTFSQQFTVTTRRNGITYMRAISISDWETGTLTPGLVGNGTQARPFKVYTVDDLVYLRNCYNNPSRTINNQPITENTEIRIMRSDIELTPANWSAGIANFIGHISYTTTGITGTSQAIENNSGRPLFTSIAAGGDVDGLTVNMSADIVINGTNFSPLCSENRGIIRNCHVTSLNGAVQGLINIQTASGTVYGLAGICINNYGEINGSGCAAQFSSRNRNVVGICLNNQTGGMIQGCYISAPMSIKAANTAAGICHTNYNGATVKDCYFSTITDSVNCNWGAIVHTNRGTVEHCYSRETASIISSGSVGGIVNFNNNGTVNYCWSEAALKGNGVGLIAAQIEGGRIINCFCNNPLTSVTLHATSAAHYGGGLVGDAAGSTNIENCYAYINKVQLINNTGYIGGLVGRIRDNSVRITNCYVYEMSGGSQTFAGSVDASATEPFSYCYLVGGTGTQPSGIENITTANAALAASNTEGLTYKLNQNVPANGGKSWQLSGSVPVLEPYSKH